MNLMDDESVARLLMHSISDPSESSKVFEKLIQRLEEHEDHELTLRAILTHQVKKEEDWEKQADIWCKIVAHLGDRFVEKSSMTNSQMCAYSCASCNPILIRKVFWRDTRRISFHFWVDNPVNITRSLKFSRKNKMIQAKSLTIEYSVLSFILSITDHKKMKMVAEVVFNETEYDPHLVDDAILYPPMSAWEYELYKHRYVIPDFMKEMIENKRN